MNGRYVKKLTDSHLISFASVLSAVQSELLSSFAVQIRLVHTTESIARVSTSRFRCIFFFFNHCFRTIVRFFFYIFNLEQNRCSAVEVFLCTDAMPYVISKNNIPIKKNKTLF